MPATFLSLPLELRELIYQEDVNALDKTKKKSDTRTEPDNIEIREYLSLYTLSSRLRYPRPLVEKFTLTYTTYESIYIRVYYLCSVY